MDVVNTGRFPHRSETVNPSFIQDGAFPPLVQKVWKVPPLPFDAIYSCLGWALLCRAGGWGGGAGWGRYFSLKGIRWSDSGCQARCSFLFSIVFAVRRRCEDAPAPQPSQYWYSTMAVGARAPASNLPWQTMAAAGTIAGVTSQIKRKSNARPRHGEGGEWHEFPKFVFYLSLFFSFFFIPGW